MSKTSEHLNTAVAALGAIRSDNGGSVHAQINIHRCAEAVECISRLPGGSCKLCHSDVSGNGDFNRYDVAEAMVGDVRVVAFGPHVACKAVDA